jgi:hypothetical protein
MQDGDLWQHAFGGSSQYLFKLYTSWSLVAVPWT